MSDAVDVHDEDHGEGAPASFLPPPTLPAGMQAGDQGHDNPAPPPAGPNHSAESAVNKKPYFMVKLGRRLCGLR